MRTQTHQPDKAIRFAMSYPDAFRALPPVSRAKLINHAHVIGDGDAGRLLSTLASITVEVIENRRLS